MRTSLCLVVCLAVLCAIAHAQSTFGTVLGVVHDPSGAAVRGARLTLTEPDENTTLTAVSNDVGLYEFLNVRPSCYELAVDKLGFATAKATGLRLEARQSLRVDFTLQIASRTDTAIVVASVPVANTENGAISDSKTFEQITRLPANYRALTASPLPAIMIFPGVQQDDFGGISIAGGLPAQTEFTVDGISTLNVFGGGALGLRFRFSDVISPEAVSEFRVSSIGNKAEFGQVNDVTLVTKSGTNILHGSLLWYHQNAALDAKTYAAPVKQKKVFNAFGGAFNGPVVLPHLYRGTNRTFFFVDYEGSRKPNTVLQQFSVPSAAMRAGDLNGLPGGAAVDPSTGAPFPGNVIPSGRINSVARSLLTNYIPLPNYPGVNKNYRRLTPENTNDDLLNLRLDQMIGSRQQLYGRWSLNSGDYPDVQGMLPSGRLPTLTNSFVASHTFAIQPNMSNEARFGVTYLRQDEVYPLQGKQVIATLGLQGLDLSNVGNSGGFPYIDFSDGTGFDQTNKLRDTHTRSQTYQYSDALSWSKGRHLMKLGGEARWVSYTGTLHGGDGADDFGGLEFYSNTFSGNAFADLLLGLPAVSDYASLGPNISEAATHYAFFEQDDWRVTNRLTVSFGLRWELHPPMHEAHGNITNFDHSTGDAIVPDHSLPPAPGFLAGINACPGFTATIPCTRILTASQAGLPQTLRKTYYGDWNPRLAFAWQPFQSNKMVLRGGAGIYTQMMMGVIGYELAGIHSSDVRDFNNQAPDGRPLFTLPRISPGGLGEVIIGGENFFDGTDPTLKDPRVYQWDFTIERELPGSNLVRASYIGSHSTGMPARVDFNQVPASAVPLNRQRTPYPAYSTLYSAENLGFSSYEGLQLEASHRFRGDFFFQVSYVLSKNLGSLGNPSAAVFPQDLYSAPITDRYNTRADRGNLPGARRQRFLLTGLFPLPFGKGRRFGTSWGRLPELFAGGWELSTITMLETGPYDTPTIGAGFDQSNTGLNSIRGPAPRPDRIGNGNLNDPGRDHYWDASAFRPVPAGAGRFGNAGRGILEGPGTVAIAAGLSKTFYAAEHLRIRLEGTFTNLPNHPNFLSPLSQINNPFFGRLTTVQSAENSGNRNGQVGIRVEF